MIAGVDIGGTKIAIGLVDDSGVVVSRVETPVQVDRGPEDAARRVSEILRVLLRGAGVKLRGIGIACTGPVDPRTGRLGDVNTLPGWQGWNPVEELSEAFEVRTAMENDADAAALGEARWGAARGKGSVVCLIVGTGIGAGMIFNGEVYRGGNYSHPELGHHIVEPLGPLCTCGANGCWESLASGPALEHWFTEQNPGKAKLTAREICALARTGDGAALHAVNHLGKYLGMGLANIVSILTPDAIVLGGSVMQSADLFLDHARAIVAANCRLVPSEVCDIAVSSLGADIGVIGAAQVWHNRFQP